MGLCCIGGLGNFCMFFVGKILYCIDDDGDEQIQYGKGSNQNEVDEENLGVGKLFYDWLGYFY